MRLIIIVLAASICFGKPRVVRKPMSFEATAYAARGETASGTRCRVGMVAADPRVLPLGTRIRVSGPGAVGVTGTYIVAGTGGGGEGGTHRQRRAEQGGVGGDGKGERHAASVSEAYR